MRKIPVFALLLLLVASLGVPACFFGPTANSSAIKTQALAHSQHTGHGEPAGHTPPSPHHPASMPDFCAIACMTLAAAPAVFRAPDWPEGQRLLPPPPQSTSPRVAERIERPPRDLS